MAELIQAGEFATEGEQQVARRLRDELPADWVVITNKLLPLPDGRSFEIDLILLTSRRVFVLDEKGWGGTISGNSSAWRCADGRTELNPLNKIATVAKATAGELRQRVRSQLPPDHFVESGVIFSNPTVRLQVVDPHRGHELLPLDRASAILRQRHAQADRSLSPACIAAIRAFFVGCAGRPLVPREISPYQIDEVEPSRPGVQILAATAHQRRYRLMLYDLGGDPFQRAQRTAYYQREFAALRGLQATGVVPHAEMPFPWGEAKLVVPVELPSGTALSSRPYPSDRASLLEDLQIATAAFSALSQIHERQVLHRALSPTAITVVAQHPTRVVLSDFYAARIEDQPSIAPSLDQLTLHDPYAAPELAAGYGGATPASDCFSLGLLLLERLTATPVGQLRMGDSVVWPSLLKRWPLPQDQEAITRLQQLFAQLMRSDPAVPPPVAATATETFAQILRLLQQPFPAQERLFDERYQLQRLLGEGAMARTFLVTDVNHPDQGVFAVKQFRHPQIALGQAEAEFTALQKLRSRHVPRIFELYKPSNEIHLKMEYIPGRTLTEREAEFPLPLGLWWEWARQLLETLAMLERHRLLHRDMKPANLLIHEEDQRLVLIDFGFAIPFNAQSRAAGTPIYQPPEALTSPTPPPDSDRYAAAVLLFRMLTAELPFVEADRQRLRTPETLHHLDLQRQRLAVALLSALDPDPNQRPTLAAWRQQIERALLVQSAPPTPELSLHENSWVTAIRGLYRNSQGGNADNRGLDSDFVRQTYVPTQLDLQLLPELLAERPLALFLCGNPGDGKTAFLEQVRATLLQQGGEELQGDASGWEITLAGHTFRSCYDASEAHAGRSANEQLNARLASLEGKQEPHVALTVLVAINDGRLLDYFEQVKGTFSWLDQQIDRAMRLGRGVQGRVWYVDLKQRAFVSFPDAPTPSTFQQLLAKLVDPSRWEVCTGCRARSICPITQNAARLRHPQVSRRLETLLLLVHLQQQRHITMRDLRSALAYLITGNLQCQDVHQAYQSADGGTSLLAFHYWQSAFASQEQADELLNDLRALDPLHVDLPHLDRWLLAHRRADQAEERRRLFAADLDDDLAPHHFLEPQAWADALKRRLFFEGQEQLLARLNWLQLLPYCYAREFVDLLAQKRLLDAAIRARLASAIWRSDGVNVELPPGKMNLVIDQSAAQRLIVAKEFPLDDFTLSIQQPDGAEVVEVIAEALLFEHRTAVARLPIKLDLFELLMRLADGLHPTTPELRSLLEDLAPFKSSLLLATAQSLLLIEAGRYRHRLEQQQPRLMLRTDGDARL